jgi:DNA repair exonuclease SbcCD ATPase subunit
MFDELNRQLMDLREKMNINSRLQKKLSSARQSLFDQRSKLSQLEAILERETKDVRRLEGLSITALFYTILGSKDQQLEKERQEYLAAKLKYDECGQAVSAIESEMSSIELRIRSLGNLEERYAALIAEKEKLVATTDNPVLKKYIDLSERLADLQSNIEEMNEAIRAGEAVIEGLGNVIKSLNSAESWGTWDMLGGGMIVTAIKHSRIDDARSWISHVQHSLRHFQRELTDVNIGRKGNSGIDIGGFETFSDYFFDCLITDWVVQGKIKDSLRNAELMLDGVQNIVIGMQAALVGMRERVNAVRDEKCKLIESA